MSYRNPKNIFKEINNKKASPVVSKKESPVRTNSKLSNTISPNATKTPALPSKEVEGNVLAVMSKDLMNKPSTMETIRQQRNMAESHNKRELDKFKAFKGMDAKKMATEYKGGINMTSPTGQPEQKEAGADIVIPPMAPVAPIVDPLVAPVAPIVDPLVEATNTNFSPRTQFTANNIFGTTSDRGLV